MKYLAILTAVIFSLFSCNKEESTEVTKSNPTTIDELNVSSNFSWSSSDEGVLHVNMENISNGNISTEGEILLLIDDKDKVLARSIISNSQTTFNLKLPVNNGEKYYLLYPNSANKQALTSLSGNVNMQFAPSNEDRFSADRSTLVYDKDAAYKYFNPSKTLNRSLNDLGPNLVQNGEFTIDNMLLDSRHWTELRDPGKWYYTNSQATHPTNIDGDLVYHNYSSSYEVIEQSFAVLGGSEYSFSMDFGYTSSTTHLNLYLDNFNENGEWIGETYVTTSGNTVSSTGTILNNATSFQFYVGLYGGLWVDNITYNSVDVNPDTDGDGVNNIGDDYPNDATKAYKVLYPTTGIQTISFEDLWPSKGDYDFNDLVISFNAEYSLNAQGKYVAATFNVDIDAAGGSIPLGLGIQFLDGNKQVHSQNLFQSITGTYSTLDPDVDNCIIVFNNRHTPMPVTYTNTSTNLTGDPVTVSCNLEMNPNFTGVALPNIFAFYTNERGREIHLPLMPSTPAANSNLFGTFDDDGNTKYRTNTGLPWAIEVVQNTKVYQQPLEKVVITEAYSKFINWANTNGSQDADWYVTKNTSKVFSKN